MQRLTVRKVNPCEIWKDDPNLCGEADGGEEVVGGVQPGERGASVVHGAELQLGQPVMCEVETGEGRGGGQKTGRQPAEQVVGQVQVAETGNWDKELDRQVGQQVAAEVEPNQGWAGGEEGDSIAGI